MMGPGDASRPSDDDLDSESTRLRILEGALHTLGRHGTVRLRMNAVSSYAGVARGTLYRYFPTKTDLFAALVDYERRRFAQAMQHAVDEVPDRPRIDVLLDFIVEYLSQHPALERLLQDEPEFVLRYLRSHLAFLRHAAAEVIRPVIPEGTRATVDGGSDVAEVILRVLIANFLVPPDDPPAVNRTLKALLGAMATPGG